MRARSLVSIWIWSLAALASVAQAGNQDLRSNRLDKRTMAQQLAQEAQKQRLLMKLRAEAPVQREPREPATNPLDVPLFKERG